MNNRIVISFTPSSSGLPVPRWLTPELLRNLSLTDSLYHQERHTGSVTIQPNYSEGNARSVKVVSEYLIRLSS